MTDLTRRQILMGGAAVAVAGAIPSIPKTPITPEIRLMQNSLAQDIAKPVIRPESMVRLHANENPYGQSRVALQAIVSNMHQASQYSFFGNAFKLIELLAEMNGVSKDMVTTGAGSNEILHIAGLMASQNGGSVVCADPTYQALLRYAKNSGSEIVRVPVDEDLNTDLDAMRAAVRDDTYMIYLVNPNNPIPAIIEKKAMRDFVLEMAEKHVVFIDEAYHEYVDNPDYESMMDLVIAGHKNIIISRTASKIHGLAGLRVGFGFAHPEIITKMRKLKTGSTNVLAIEAARASYLDQEFPEYTRRQNQKSLNIVNQMCDELGLRYVKSNTNFTFVETGMENKVFREKMKAFGILTGRDFNPFQDRWSRISMSTPEEMEYFVQVYKQLFS